MELGLALSLLAGAPVAALSRPASSLRRLVDGTGHRLVDTEGNALLGTTAVDEGEPLAALAARKGLVFGTSYQAEQRMTLPGPGGVGTLADFIASQADLYVPGIAMMPQHVQPQHGVFDTSLLEAFLTRVSGLGKQWRAHVLHYPEKESAWVAATIDAENWRSEMEAHIAAIAAVPGVRTCTNIDVVNELFGVGSTNPGGWRTTPWTIAAGDFLAPAVHAFALARAYWPTTPLYWCQDHSEQITGSAHRNHVANILAGLEAALSAGAEIEGYAMQAHLTYRLGFDPVRLRAFLRDLRSLGLRIVISELDARTGYRAPDQTDTRPPQAYPSPWAYDLAGADLYKRFLDIALPFVAESGGQLLAWSLTDHYHAWPDPPGERPSPWDETYQPKPQHHALRDALLEL